MFQLCNYRDSRFLLFICMTFSCQKLYVYDQNFIFYCRLLKDCKIQLICTKWGYIWMREISHRNVMVIFQETFEHCVHILTGNDRLTSLVLTSSSSFSRFTGVAAPLRLPHAAGSCNKDHPSCWRPHQAMVGLHIAVSYNYKGLQGSVGLSPSSRLILMTQLFCQGARAVWLNVDVELLPNVGLIPC